MKRDSFKTLSASELLEMTSDRCFSKLVFQEYAKMREVPLRGTTFHYSRKENAKNNRYCNIQCWDHTRVVISNFNEGDSESSGSYIHANFVDGYEEFNKYICAQTPLESNWESFFTLIWEQQSFVIVSLTDLDRDDQKNYKLWLDPGSETTFGSYVVKILDVKKQISFTKTKLQISNTETKASRKLTNFWFTEWPDNRNLQGIEEFLELRSQVNQEQVRLKKEAAENGSQSPGPIIVHCSTGTGCTGTFCAIDNALEQLDKEKKVSVPQIVLDIRSQRYASVYLPEQYELCYLVLRHVLEEDRDEKY